MLNQKARPQAGTCYAFGTKPRLEGRPPSAKIIVFLGILWGMFHFRNKSLKAGAKTEDARTLGISFRRLCVGKRELFAG